MKKIIIPLLILVLAIVVMGIRIDNQFIDSEPVLVGEEVKLNTLIEKVNEIDINNFRHEDIIGTLGTPEKYIWERSEYKAEDLPANYIMIYSDAFHIRIMNDYILELRFYDDIYVTESGVRVGSSLDEVIEILGEPATTITGEALKSEFNVLQKDIDGRVGHCYYFFPDQNIRFFCTDYIVNALYITNDYAGRAMDSIVKPAIDGASNDTKVINETFVEDRQIHGQWETIGYALVIEDFDPNNLHDQYGHIVETIEIKDGGSVNYEHLKWTKGLIYHIDSQISYEYTVKNIEDESYLFLLAKGGEYSLSYKKPMYLVMKKLDE